MKPTGVQPVYLQSRASEAFPDKIAAAFKILEDCTLCPRQCRVNRLRGERGTCRGGYLPQVASYAPHFGEEQPLVGRSGSGTIFLAHCNLRCCFCQNYSISHLGEGREVSFERLARMMIELQSLGCHNINFVTPTHYAAQLLEAIQRAAAMGLRIPLVYNSSGYDSVSTLKLLDGVFDIYMPDFKFGESGPAAEYCSAADYPEIAKLAIKEMHRQVGDLVIDKDGIAVRGLLVRHLVLPHGEAGTRQVLHFIASEISRNTYVNLMDQYYPCAKVTPHTRLGRRVSAEEFAAALGIAREEGLTRLDKRDRHHPIRF
jgi:putative pyruvate formate lyase activating enzyme